MNTSREFVSLQLFFFILDIYRFFRPSFSISAYYSFFFANIFQALFMIPFSILLHSGHLEFSARILSTHFLHNICWQDTCTGFFRVYLQYGQFSCGLYFSRSLIYSGSSSSPGLIIRFHLSLSDFSKSFSSSQPVLQSLLSCRQMQLLPNTQYPESCQSLHRLGSQSNRQVFLAPFSVVERVGPCFHLQCSRGLSSYSWDSLQLAQLCWPRYIFVLSLPSFIFFVIQIVLRYRAFASSVSCSCAAASPASTYSYLFYFAFLQEIVQNYLCSSSALLLRFAVEPPIAVLVCSGFYSFTRFLGQPFTYCYRYGSYCYWIQERFILLFLVLRFLNILLQNLSRKLQKKGDNNRKYYSIDIIMQQQQPETQKPGIPRTHKPRNLALKLLLSHLDANLSNLGISLQQALKTLDQQIVLALEISQARDKTIQRQEIRKELEIFCDEVRNSPARWLRMLGEGEIQREGNRAVLNDGFTITEIYEKIIDSIDERVNKNRQDKSGSSGQIFNFEQWYCDQTIRNLLATLLHSLSQQLVLAYQKSKAYIMEQTQLIEQQLKKSQIMNTYVLFGMLKQMSKWSHAEARRLLGEGFEGIGEQVAEQFCRFVQANYQILHLHYRSNEEHRLLSRQELNEIVEEKNKKIFQQILKRVIQMTPPANTPETQNPQQPAQSIIDQLIKQNEQLSSQTKKNKKWKLVDLKDSFSGLFKVFKTSIQGQIKADTSTMIQSDLMTVGVPQSANLGGSLGKCLVDIDNYKSAEQFFADLSKTAMIGGSITILLQQIPIFNYFIIAGGLSYTVYRTYNDQISSSLKKMKQLGKASIVAAGSVGSTITGMMIGEVVIPVPFLGAFIGGVIGGYFGEKGSRELTAILNDKSFMKLIKYLQDTVHNDESWFYSDQILHKLGMSKKFFDETFCPFESQKNAKITCICFFIAAHYESRKQIEYTQKKLKQKQKQEQSKLEVQKQKLKNAIINEQQFFKSQFNVVAILEYLSRNDVYLVTDLGRYEPIVKHLTG